MEENLGHKLRRARESAGLTVDDAVYRARMPRAVVLALEADDFGFFTSPLYARSFLKQYGDYVGLDVSPWLEDLVPTAMIDGDAVDSIIGIGDAAPPAPREKRIRSGGGGSLAALWLVVLTGGLVWGGMELYRDFERKHALVPAPVPEAAEKPAPQPVAVETAVEADEKIPIAEPEPPRRAIIVRDE